MDGLHLYAMWYVLKQFCGPQKLVCRWFVGMKWMVTKGDFIDKIEWREGDRNK